jgi:hypothetical protein
MMPHRGSRLSLKILQTPSKGDMFGDADDIEAVKGIVQDSEPGRFPIDEIADRPILAGNTARKWGSAVKFPNGTVILERDHGPVAQSLLRRWFECCPIGLPVWGKRASKWPKPIGQREDRNRP